MVAAALTVWLMFGFWIAAPTLGVPSLAARAACSLLVAELVLLLAFSYGTEGCDEPDCAPLAQAFGVAARLDVPVLAALLFAVVALRGTLLRRTRRR
jgi:hypothetical protein